MLIHAFYGKTKMTHFPRRVLDSIISWGEKGESAKILLKFETKWNFY